MGPKTSTERAVTIFQNKKNGGEAETKIGVTVENHLNAPDDALEALLAVTTGAFRGLHAGQARTGEMCPLRKSEGKYRPVVLLEICHKLVMATVARRLALLLNNTSSTGVRRDNTRAPEP